MKRSEFFIFLAIVVVAVFFRFWHLGQLPPGLSPDVAMNGNSAIQALEGGFSAKGGPASGWKVFYPENNGREGLMINLQALSIAHFGNTIDALKFPVAVAGILTVIGLYFLTRLLFGWHIAALSSFLMAISFWHVHFSRIGLDVILAPCVLVWGLYFFWKGLSRGHSIDFLISGILWGLGVYSSIAFRVMPLVIVAVLAAYWHALRQGFNHHRYMDTRNKLAIGFVLFIGIAGIVAAPLGFYFIAHPQDFSVWPVSVFQTAHPIQTLIGNFIKTLGMFNFVGDRDWRYNDAGQPLLFWPIGIFFAIGLIRNIVKIITGYRRSNHLSTTHTLLLSWFVVGLIPAFISNRDAQALQSLIVAPVVFLFAGEGLWWLFQWCEHWYRQRDLHQMDIILPQRHHVHAKESTLVVVAVLIVFCAAITIAEYNRYFIEYASNPSIAAVFNENYVHVAQRINTLPAKKLKYVYVNAGGVLVNGIPLSAQAVMYLTDTYTSEKQKAKSIFYLTEEQYRHHQYRRDGIVIPLEP